MSRRAAIAFWIIFPILTLLFTGIVVFYFSLANGPLFLFILECIAIGLFIIWRIILRHRKFYLRMIPTLSVIFITVIAISLAKPTVERKSAAYYDNPVATETLELKNGLVQGVYNEDKSVEIYAGVPYAKAPVGDLRWKEPESVENWTGTLDCGYFGPRAMQTDQLPFINGLVDMYAEKAWHPDFTMHPEQNMSEDCLYLNIWRPKEIKEKLPILVFIHGGSLTSGSSSYEDYNGEEMAKTGVIMITIAYRVGVFGYYAHEDLIKESPNDTTGNYGLLDQIQALKWVNENADYFGGDASNITIAGESAGSSSISAICTSPLAKGLFKRAIGESSSLVVKIPPHTYRQKEEALKMGQDIMEEYHCSSIEELRKVPAEELVKTEYTNSAMMLDGYALNKDPYQVYLDKENNEEALLNGYNILEGDAFVIPTYLLSPTNKGNILERLQAFFGDEYGQKFYDIYKDKIEVDAFSVFNEVFSVYWFMYPHYSWMNMAYSNNEDVYSYQFTKENGFHGTYHAGEMIYAYGNVKRDTHTYRYDESDVALSNTMLSYWSNFAKTGNPNSEGLPTWDKYVPAREEIMELGSKVGPKDIEHQKAFALCEEYVNYLASKGE
ncbi:MAG: carboxylesterase family protein [Bacilli bacterium]|nr:carboxylesterase family protein [Bacilli bacterium]